jgi:hypothetical protein
LDHRLTVVIRTRLFFRGNFSVFTRRAPSRLRNASARPGELHDKLISTLTVRNLMGDEAKEEQSSILP